MFADRIGTSKRDGMMTSGDQSPGPGRYSPNRPGTERSSPKYTFGSKERSSLN